MEVLFLEVTCESLLFIFVDIIPRQAMCSLNSVNDHVGSMPDEAGVELIVKTSRGNYTMFEGIKTGL